MTMRSARVLLAAAVLAACGAEPPVGTLARAARDSASAAAGGRDTADSTSVPAAGVIVLAPDGLEIPSSGGAPTRLAFGAPQVRVLADAGAMLGQPVEQGTQEECPAGELYYAQYGAGLHLVFQDSAFAGWSAGDGSPLRTAAGVGPGSTLGELRRAYPAATVEETSLGMEFAAGEMWGIVSDSSEAGRVELLFAGTNCVFR